MTVRRCNHPCDGGGTALDDDDDGTTPRGAALPAPPPPALGVAAPFFSARDSLMTSSQPSIMSIPIAATTAQMSGCIQHAPHNSERQPD
jgi:hypothetical protein